LELAEHLCEALAPLGAVGVRRFFGGWALHCRGVQFAMVMDTLYLRVDDRTRPAYEAAGSEPFRYRTGKREVEVRRLYSAPPEALDDPERLCELAREAMVTAQPAARKSKPGRGKGGARPKRTQR
jgi:TfoX/Sxy family transcriptional regulator of competence genes